MRLAVASPNQRRAAFRVGWLFLAVLAFALRDVQGGPRLSRRKPKRVLNLRLSATPDRLSAR